MAKRTDLIPTYNAESDAASKAAMGLLEDANTLQYGRNGNVNRLPTGLAGRDVETFNSVLGAGRMKGEDVARLESFYILGCKVAEQTESTSEYGPAIVVAIYSEELDGEGEFFMSLANQRGEEYPQRRKLLDVFTTNPNAAIGPCHLEEGKTQTGQKFFSIRSR